MPTAIEGEMLNVAINGKAECVEVADSPTGENAVGKALDTKSLNVAGATPIGAVESVLVAVEEGMELKLVLTVDSENGLGDSGLYELYWDIGISA